MERNRRPPDVEEALSSMLWTPYQRTQSDSSDEENIENSTKTQLKSAITVSDLYSITEQHFKPIRYPKSFAANYGNFAPKSYNSLNCQLPSYEHVENERSRRRLSNYFFNGLNSNRMNSENNSNTSENINNKSFSKNNDGNSDIIANYDFDNSNSNYNCVSNGIYVIQEQSKNSTSILHSFTENFLQYEVINLLIFLFYVFLHHRCITRYVTSVPL